MPHAHCSRDNWRTAPEAGCYTKPEALLTQTFIKTLELLPTHPTALGYKGGVREMTLKYEVTFFGESVSALTRSNLAMGCETDSRDK